MMCVMRGFRNNDTFMLLMMCDQLCVMHCLAVDLKMLLQLKLCVNMRNGDLKMFAVSLQLQLHSEFAVEDEFGRNLKNLRGDRSVHT